MKPMAGLFHHTHNEDFDAEVGISDKDKLLHSTIHCEMQLLMYTWDVFFCHQSSDILYITVYGITTFYTEQERLVVEQNGDHSHRSQANVLWGLQS